MAVEPSPDSALGDSIPADKMGKALSSLASNPKVKAAFEKFIGAISKHQIEAGVKSPKSLYFADASPISNEAKDAVKENKLLIVQLLKELPKEVRDAVELHKSKVGDLVRGVVDRKITEKGKWTNGNFVYGFTDSSDIANSFSASDEHTQVTPELDIESFGGAIDVPKVYELFKAYNESVWRRMGVKSGSWWKGTPMPDDSLSKNEKYKKSFEAARSKYLSEAMKNPYQRYSGDVVSNPFAEENEALLYDIKFKKSGDDFYSDVEL